MAHECDIFMEHWRHCRAARTSGLPHDYFAPPLSERITRCWRRLLAAIARTL